MNLNQFIKKNDSITLEQLKSFILVYELGSVSLTASFTNKTQPAISQQIAKLESKLNTKLIKSNRGKSISFTEEGHRFYQQIRPILVNLLTQIDEIESKNTISIGVCDDLDMTIQTRIVSELNTVVDGRVRLLCDFSHKIRELVNQRQLDFGITKTLVNDESVSHKFGWASRYAVDYNDENKLAIVSAHTGCFMRQLVEKILIEQNKDFYFSYLANNIHNQLAAVKAGFGVGIFQLKTIQSHQDLILLDETYHFHELPSFQYEVIGHANSFLKHKVNDVLYKEVLLLNS